MFKLACLGSGQTFTLIAPELSVPGVSPEMLQRVLSQANKANMAAFSPPRLFAAWRDEAPFSPVSRFDGFYTWCHLLSRCVIRA